MSTSPPLSPHQTQAPFVATDTPWEQALHHSYPHLHPTRGKRPTLPGTPGTRPPKSHLQSTKPPTTTTRCPCTQTIQQPITEHQPSTKHRSQTRCVYHSGPLSHSHSHRPSQSHTTHSLIPLANHTGPTGKVDARKFLARFFPALPPHTFLKSFPLPPHPTTPHLPSTPTKPPPPSSPPPRTTPLTLPSRFLVLDDEFVLLRRGDRAWRRDCCKL